MFIKQNNIKQNKNILLKLAFKAEKIKLKGEI